MDEHLVQNIDALLRAGMDAAKAGDRARARELLMQVVEADERRPQAWLWLSGVVDGLEDREVCLENVLALDPANQAARRGLEWLRGQKERSGQPGSPPAREAVLAEVPAPASLLPPPSAQRFAVPVPETAQTQAAADRPASGPLWPDPPDVLLCPYCASPTQEQDRYCPACQGSLWVKTRRRETHSLWLWNLMVVRFVMGIFYALSPLLALAVVAYLLLGEFEPFLLLPAYLGLEHNLDPAVVQRALEMLPPVYALPLLLLSIYSFLLLAGMYMRWRPVFFLLFAGALGRLATAIGVTLVGRGYYPLLCGGSGIAAAIGSLLLLMLIYDDFCHDSMRVYFVLDQRHSGGVTRLEHARILGERGMWALAVLYLRAAAARLSSQAAPFVRLAQAYMRLKRPDLARAALEQARQIDPYSPVIAELDALLKG